MRLLAPRPILLALTLLAVVGAIAFIELRLDATVAGSANAGDTRAKAEPPTEPSTEPSTQKTARPREAAGAREGPDRAGGGGTPEKGRPGDAAERIASKEAEYTRAKEIVAPSGFINANDVSIKEAAGEKVVLVEFWTYTCFNCQNVQPHINAWYDEYSGDGLQVVGVHTPEFGFEREYANVEVAVREAGIEYPVVLDNRYATWNAYDQRYWPAIYLIDADGFVRYKHFGEGAYEETEAKIRELLAEKDRIQGRTPS